MLQHQISDSMSKKLHTPTNVIPGEAIVLYFDFWYYLGIAPFRITTCPQTGLCKVFSTKIHKICTWILMVLTFSAELAFLRMDKPGEGLGDKKEMRYFMFATRFGLGVATVLFFLTIWRKFDLIADLINHFRVSTYTRNAPSKMLKERRLAIWISLFYAIAAQLMLHIMPPGMKYNMENFYNFQCYYGKALLFGKTLELESIEPAFKIPLFLFGYSMKLTAGLFLGACGSFLICFGLAFVNYVNSLEEKAKSMTINEGLHEFSKLKILLQKNGKAVGLALSGNVFGRIPFLFFMIPELIQPTNVIESFQNILHSFPSLLFLIFAAWVTNKATHIFESWIILSNSFVKMPESQLSVFLYELGSGGLEIQGVGFIRFTSGLLGEIVSLIFTFTVVIIQFRN